MRSSNLLLAALVVGVVVGVASCTSLEQANRPPTPPAAPSATAVQGAGAAGQAGSPLPATTAEATTGAPASPVPAMADPAAIRSKTTEPVVSVAATGLDTPWALAFAPDGRLFFTERPGKIRVIENGRLRDQPVATIPVRETAEGGLMGLAVDPDFPSQPYLYAMYTYAGDRGLRNRVVRLRLEGNVAREDLVLLDDLPAGNIHDGGRVKIGPDGLLYFTIGDTAASNLAQEPRSLAGKILRLNRDGTVPSDNPFPGSPVYTLGHRNPEGLAWQPDSRRLYSTEHGPAGDDEVNLVEPGRNYGWPEAQGPDHPARFNAPLVTYSPAIAPAGATYYHSDVIPQWTDSFFFAALRGAHLHRLTFDPANPRIVVTDERLYQGEYGRLRDVIEGPDGALYVATSNRDGRGSPSSDDDRILRIGLPPETAIPQATPPAEWRMQEYPVPRGAGQHDVAPAPNGGVWYTAQRSGELGWLDPSTGQTRHVKLGERSSPHGVVVGPDGAPWVTDSGLNAIVRVDPQTGEVRRFTLPAGERNVNLNTATFDRQGILWFTGQGGFYGRLDPGTGKVEVFDAPGGRGPYGIATTPDGAVYYASLAGSHIAHIDPQTGRATAIHPPTPNQGTRRVWSDSQGRIWVSEWNVGQVGMYDPATNAWQEWRLPGDSPRAYAVYVDDQDAVWLSDFGANALLRFDPAQQSFAVFPLPSSPANVRQLHGRPGELWGAESGVDKLVVLRR